MACRLDGTKPLFEPMLEYCQLGNFSEILIEIYAFSFKEVHLKMLPGKWRPFCLGLSMLIRLVGIHYVYATHAEIHQVNSLRYGDNVPVHNS